LLARRRGDIAVAMRGRWRARWLVILTLACAGACGGEDGDKPPTFTPVSATSDGDLYTLVLGDLKMVIDGARGARITEFSLDGANLLLTRDENSSYGSTYWPSPQSGWCAAGGACWPPPAAIDMQLYAGAIGGTNVIQLASAAAPLGSVPDSAIAVSKRFTPVPESGAVDVMYMLTNASVYASVLLAPWQVSRVATGGLTFFGQGSGPATYAPDSDPAFTLTEAAGDLWYASAPVNHNSKAFADGAGWLAHVTPSRLLYLASFADIAPADAAPGEAEIEVFAGIDYIEIEAQGAFTLLAPGETLSWTVRWKLRRVPGGVAIAAGDAGLAGFAGAAIAE
jgi:hypothetical protein